MDFAGSGIDDPDPLARIIHKRLVAGHMMLAHRRRQPLFEPAQQIAEPAVAIALRMLLPVFLPQHHHIDAGPLHIPRQLRPVRLYPPPLARRNPSVREQSALQDLVGDILRQRPLQTRRRHSFQIVLDRAARHAEAPPDLARAHPFMAKPQ